MASSKQPEMIQLESAGNRVYLPRGKRQERITGTTMINHIQVLIVIIKINVSSNPRLFDRVVLGSVGFVFVELRKQWARHIKYVFP